MHVLSGGRPNRSPPDVSMDRHSSEPSKTSAYCAEHLGDDVLVDLVSVQEQGKDLPLPPLIEGLRLDLRQRNERAVGGEGAVGDQGVDEWMPMHELAKHMDGCDHAGDDVGAVERGAVDLQDAAPGEARQLAHEPAVEAEEDAQAPGDREDELAVGNGSTDIACDVLGDQEGPLLVAARTQAASAAGERHENSWRQRGQHTRARPTLRSPQPRKR